MCDHMLAQRFLSKKGFFALVALDRKFKFCIQSRVKSAHFAIYLMCSHFVMNIPDMFLHVASCRKLPLTEPASVRLNPSVSTQMDPKIVVCVSSIGTVRTFKIFNIRMRETVTRQLAGRFEAFSACLETVR